VVKRIAWAQVVVNVLYQYLENGAYLASKGVLGWSAERQTKAWLWSSRFWFAHVGLEFYRLIHQSGTRKKQMVQAMREGKASELKRDESRLKEEKAWKRDVVVNSAYAPLTVHWSLEKGIVGDFSVGMLGTIVGAVRFTELWKNTA